MSSEAASHDAEQNRRAQSRLEPLHAGPLTALAALAMFLAARVAAGPHLFDAGELIAASWDLGGSHPPGQPLHAILAHAFARIPLGPIPARVALFSAACTLWAGWLAARLAGEVADTLRAPTRLVPWAQTVAVIALGLTTPVLRQALRAEVYTLSLALTLLSMLHLTYWARGAGGRHMAAAGFAAGLAATAHPMHAAGAILFGLALAAPRLASLRRRPAPLLWAAAFAIEGMFVYAFLPARGAAGAPMWGRPTELPGLLAYVSGQAYAHNSGVDTGSVWIGRAVDVSTHVLITGAGVGLLALLLAWLRNPAQRALLGGITLGGALCLLPATLVLLDLRIADHPGYLAPGVALWIGAGAGALAALWRDRQTRALSLVGLCTLAASPYTLAHAQEYTRSDAPVLETLMGTFVDSAPARALVVPTTDFAAGGWMMARSIDGARPDVAVFIAGLATSSWHWEAMSRHPALDGTPRRGPGRDSHRQYLRGAILAALPAVPVALERDLSGLAPSALVGPYSVLTRSAGGAPSGLRSKSIGERLQPQLAREAEGGPGGDGGAVAAIMRDQLSYRGRRLLATGHTRAGLDALADSLWPLDRARRVQLFPKLDADAGRPVAIPRVVEDRASFLMSRREAERTAASALWATGHRSQAMLLLEGQGREGEGRALLQLAWLELYDGHPDDARRTLDGLLTSAPELADESRPLAAMLARLAAEPR